jgi:hypothetical protein
MSVSQGGRDGVHHQIQLLIVGLILGTFAILIASAFRDVLDAFLQMTVPISEKSLGSGPYLFLWRIFYFVLILSLLIIASISLV